MTQEDKQIVLVDLCARLPYGVILLSPNEKITYQTDGNTAAELLVEEGWISYLRPMSSMTGEEKEEYNKTFAYYDIIPCYTIESFDYLNKNMFDYRGLIEKGLALEAPEDMYDNKEQETETQKMDDERIRKAIKQMYSFLPNKPEYIGGVSVKSLKKRMEE